MTYCKTHFLEIKHYYMNISYLAKNRFPPMPGAPAVFGRGDALPTSIADYVPYKAPSDATSSHFDGPLTFDLEKAKKSP